MRKNRLPLWGWVTWHTISAFLILSIFPIDLFVTIIGLVIVPIALLFCKQDSENLPRWAWPWDNTDHGINGDGDVNGGWQGPEHANGHQREYWWRFKWLALRNPANNWSNFIGFAANKETSYIVYGDPTITNTVPARSGWCYIEAYAGCALYPCYYLIWAYTIFGSKRCVRLYFGWKNMGRPRDATVPYVFVPNPFMPVKG